MQPDKSAGRDALGHDPLDHDALDPATSGFAYTMLKAGPAVPSDDVDTPAPSIEVALLWGATVVRVWHLTPPRPFYVGEELRGRTGCDCFVPSEAIGTTRAPLLLCDEERATLVMPPGSSGYVEAADGGAVSLSELVSSGRARPSGELSGAFEYDLPPGARARLALGSTSLAFEVSVVRAAQRVPGGLLGSSEPEAFLYTALSFLFHAGIVLGLAFFVPALRDDDAESVDRDRVLTMQRYLNAAAQREREEPDEHDNAESARSEGGTGASASGEAGSLGTPAARDAGHKYAVKGPPENVDPHLARTAALDDAARFGVVGILSAMAGGDPKAPTAVWGREESLGNDPLSALGNLFGDRIGDSPGTGGLGPSGNGEGGDRGEAGIGLDKIGPFGHGAGGGPDQGIGVGRGRPGGAHPVRSPSIREAIVSINGRLPPEIIQRTVRQNFGRFRFCYQQGLQTDPGLRGRVTVKFVIDRSGAVATAADGGSDLPDQGVVHCVVRGFGNLSFPQPEGGMVTVAYPILFSPGE